MEKKCRTVPKEFDKGLSTFGLVWFRKCTKKFLAEAGLEPATAGLPLNRLKSVLKSGTYRVSSDKKGKN